MVQSMYNHLMKGVDIPSRYTSWKVKLTMKIKIFLWYLKQGVILTTDNLIKWKWKGCKTCFFYSSDETIQHFFKCHIYAHLMWNLVSMSFGFQPSTSVANLFGSWLRSVPYKVRCQIFSGTATMCWPLWLNRNDVIFQNSKPHWDINFLLTQMPCVELCGWVGMMWSFEIQNITLVCR